MVLNILVMNTWELLVVTAMIYQRTVGGSGSNGALHGLTKFSMEDAPPNHFF
jgi:hypothetical protein